MNEKNSQADSGRPDSDRPDSSSADFDEAFVQEVAEAQASLYGYALQLLADSEAAREVLAETNLTVWRKRAEFQLGTSFFAWSSRVAYYEVLAYRKRTQRDRLYFDDDLLQSLVSDASQAGADPQVLDALAHCMDATEPEDIALLEMRYVEDQPAREIAAKVGRTPHAVSQALYRIRMSLLDCIERTLAAEESE